MSGRGHVAWALGVMSVSLAVVGLAVAGDGVWTSHGPQGGYVSVIVVDPQGSNTVYAAAGGGVYKSTDAGQYWKHASVGLSKCRPGRGSNRPADVNDALCGRRRLQRRRLHEHGWRTELGGVACGPPDRVACDRPAGANNSLRRRRGWGFQDHRRRPSLDRDQCRTHHRRRVVQVLAVDPVTPATVYAGLSRVGIFKSRDAGLSWQAINLGLANKFVSALAIDPQSPMTLYAGTSAGVFKTTDGGAVWRAIPVGMGAKEVLSITIDPRTTATVYAGTSTGTFRSTDGGSRWRAMSAANGHRLGRAFAIDPQTPATIYAAAYTDQRSGDGNSYGVGRGVLKSTNGGGSWRAMNAGLNGRAVGALAVDPRRASTIYAGTYDEGVLKSTDGGLSWRPVSPRLAALSETAYVYSLAIDPRNTATVYVGTLDGLFKSTNAGRSWRGSGNGLFAKEETEVLALAVNPRSPSTLYAGLWGAGVFKSTDSGGHWRSVKRGVIVYALAIDPRTPTTVYAATGQGLARSTDAGASWTWLGPIGRSRVTALAIDPHRPATLYAGTWNGVFKSLNRGRTWRAANTGLRRRSISALVIDPQRTSTIYAGADSSVSPGTEGLFRSTDGGANWEVFSAGLTSLSVGALAITSNGSALYAGTTGGVFDYGFPR